MDEPELNQSIIHNAFKAEWKNETTRANKDAIQLSSEFLRLFVVEAVHRSSEELEAMSIASQTTNKNAINVEALERILPQLLLDF
ncbi:centromere protein X [Sporodiniella umbellata]|nr:centromere protein X [Sporodiniella umbellata]